MVRSTQILLERLARSKCLGAFATLKAILVPQLVHFRTTTVGDTALAAEAHLSLGVGLAVGAKRQTTHVKVRRIVLERLLAASMATPVLLVKLTAAGGHVRVRDGRIARFA